MFLTNLLITSFANSTVISALLNEDWAIKEIIAPSSSLTLELIFFATNSTSLDDDAKAILERQASWLELYPEISIIVEGHADERGTREYNMSLSAKRADIAISYLESLGVAGDRVETVPYGKERPVAACSSEACWSQNRRAVSVVITEE